MTSLEEVGKLVLCALVAMVVPSKLLSCGVLATFNNGDSSGRPKSIGFALLALLLWYCYARYVVLYPLLRDVDALYGRGDISRA